MDDQEDVMDDRPQPPVTRETVEARVKDWKKRLGDLFREISVWAGQNGWQVAFGAVSMHEELMRKFNVPMIDQPTLRLDSADGYALFKPKGLWVIGANGRVDLYTSKGTFIIVDSAEHGKAPHWTIYRAPQKRDGEHFTPDMIRSLT